MKAFILPAIAAAILLTAVQTHAQDFHCYKAMKKEWKSEKKEDKIRPKMFHDRQCTAARKYRKSVKKAWKSDMHEYAHRHYCAHHWY